MGRAAEGHGLNFVAEGFIDRRYTDDGHLLSRKIDGAVIKDQTERLEQACRSGDHGPCHNAFRRNADIENRIALCSWG